MHAIELLEGQHREVEEMFEQFEAAGERARARKEQLCRKIGDALAIHAAIEEKIFYPATKSSRTEDELREAVEEHLAAKRVIADLLDTEVADEQFDAKMKVLKEMIEHHVQEEEGELFPMARKQLGSQRLEELGEEMEEMAGQLEEQGDARMQVKDETDRAAPI
ncbi:MAG TPA: hemerythrin domain-containing protein [Anaeromyxobacteraceae bacterium]|nr:hemerythrin domain-containing protein [Anaeromyxobacteraceae bacterium]